MRSKWKLWLIPLVVLLLVGTFKGGDLWSKDEKLQEAPVQNVTARTVSQVRVENKLTLTGDVQAVQEAVLSAQVAGRVRKVVVENGAAVSAGQALVFLENQDFINTLAVNQATMKKADNVLTTARNNYGRFQELFKQGAIAEKEFEDVTMALKIAEADVDSAAAALAMAEKALQDATLTAPISGLVANRDVTTGKMVSPQGDPLMTLQDISSVYVVVNIEQKDLAQIRPGLRAEVTIDAYGNKTFNGVVEVMNPVAKQGARVFETKIKVNNPKHFLKPGMFAKVQLKTGEASDILAVPQAALLSKQGLYFVFVPEGDKVKRKQVEIGQILDQLVEIKQGLSEGEQVIVTNVNKLKDQDQVKISK